MPTYKITHAEQGIRYRVYKVVAVDEEEATEKIFEENISPVSERFKQLDGNMEVVEL